MKDQIQIKNDLPYFNQKGVDENNETPMRLHTDTHLQNQEEGNKINLEYEKQKNKLNQKKLKAEQELYEKTKNLQKLKKKQQIIQKNSLDLFNIEIQQLHVELKNKYLGINHDVIDQENWELMESYKSYFQQGQSKQDFQKKYVKLAASGNLKYCNCECCRNSNQSICYCPPIQKCFKACVLCSCWWTLQLFIIGTCGIVLLPYCFCNQYKANSLCGYKACQKGCNQSEDCCSNFPKACESCVCCPIISIVNIGRCVCTCCCDYVACCKIVCCGKKQVITKLSKIYQKYEKKILQGQAD